MVGVMLCGGYMRIERNHYIISTYDIIRYDRATVVRRRRRKTDFVVYRATTIIS